MLKNSKIILGIDPGTIIMGFGLIKISGSSISLLEMGVLKLSPKKDNYQRLKLIHQKVQALIEKHSPNEFAIEAPFFGKNVQSMLKLGRAQGVAIAAAMSFNIPVTEYAPKKIKQSIAGNGNADKEQVWKMLQRLLNIKEKEISSFNASDALAVAVCHHFQSKKLAPKNGTLKGWSDFVAKNSSRIRTVK